MYEAKAGWTISANRSKVDITKVDIKHTLKVSEDSYSRYYANGNGNPLGMVVAALCFASSVRGLKKAEKAALVEIIEAEPDDFAAIAATLRAVNRGSEEDIGGSVVELVWPAGVGKDHSTVVVVKGADGRRYGFDELKNSSGATSTSAVRYIDSSSPFGMDDFLGIMLANLLSDFDVSDINMAVFSGARFSQGCGRVTWEKAYEKFTNPVTLNRRKSVYAHRHMVLAETAALFLDDGEKIAEEARLAWEFEEKITA